MNQKNDNVIITGGHTPAKRALRRYGLPTALLVILAALGAMAGMWWFVKTLVVLAGLCLALSAAFLLVLTYRPSHVIPILSRVPRPFFGLFSYLYFIALERLKPGGTAPEFALETQDKQSR